MAREVASTRIPGNELQRTPVVKGTFLRPLYLVPHRLTPAERHRRISELAYKRAELRGFAPGNEAEDWLDAEREVDAGRY
ncbi:MAG: hypothetical protein QOI59_4061 [Gammaproteobacteria bacterium]|jgi:hypothetical protein|nr:hypothetical protein [Gammaproteobacteria bacterium]